VYIGPLQLSSENIGGRKLQAKNEEIRDKKSTKNVMDNVPQLFRALKMFLSGSMRFPSTPSCALRLVSNHRGSPKLRGLHCTSAMGLYYLLNVTDSNLWLWEMCYRARLQLAEPFNICISGFSSFLAAGASAFQQARISVIWLSEIFMRERRICSDTSPELYCRAQCC